MSRKFNQARPLEALTPKSKLGTVFYIDIKPDDIATAVCFARRDCVAERAIERTLGLDKKVRASVEASGVNVPSYLDHIFDFVIFSDGLRVLLDFDELAKRFGLVEARRRMAPTRFHIELYKVRRRRPYHPMDDAAIARIRAAGLAQEANDAAREEIGLPPTSSRKRYAGVQI